MMTPPPFDSRKDDSRKPNKNQRLKSPNQDCNQVTLKSSNHKKSIEKGTYRKRTVSPIKLIRLGSQEKYIFSKKNKIKITRKNPCASIPTAKKFSNMSTKQYLDEKAVKISAEPPIIILDSDDDDDDQPSKTKSFHQTKQLKKQQQKNRLPTASDKGGFFFTSRLSSLQKQQVFCNSYRAPKKASPKFDRKDDEKKLTEAEPSSAAMALKLFHSEPLKTITMSEVDQFFVQPSPYQGGSAKPPSNHGHSSFVQRLLMSGKNNDGDMNQVLSFSESNLVQEPQLARDYMLLNDWELLPAPSAVHADDDEVHLITSLLSKDNAEPTNVFIFVEPSVSFEADVCFNAPLFRHYISLLLKNESITFTLPLHVYKCPRPQPWRPNYFTLTREEHQRLMSIAINQRRIDERFGCNVDAVPIDDFLQFCEESPPPPYEPNNAEGVLWKRSSC